MNDYKNLIKELRKTHIVEYGSFSIKSYPNDNEKAAADAIEQLVKERDAAIKDMKKCWLCASCKKRIKGKEWAFCCHFEVEVQKVNERNTSTCKNYEWRGVTE